MIVKLVGASLIISAGGWIGLEKAFRLSRRTRAIRQIRMDLEFLEKEIGFARNPLEQALNRTAHISSEPARGLFATAGRALRKNPSTTAREAWGQGVEHLVESGGLTPEDLNVINLIGERLGTSDVNDQIRMLRQAGAELKVQEEKSRQQEEREKKLWSYGGFLVGLMISILMI